MIHRPSASTATGAPPYLPLMAFARVALTWLLTFALMSALGWFVKQQTPDFVEGMAVGMIGTTASLLACHKLGVRIF